MLEPPLVIRRLRQTNFFYREKYYKHKLHKDVNFSTLVRHVRCMHDLYDILIRRQLIKILINDKNYLLNNIINYKLYSLNGPRLQCN